MSIDYTSVYEEQRGFLWGYCYRLSGDAAEADDLVQDTFVRILENPPADTSRPWRPWLVRVATNLARDEARRASRRAYVGPWLPTPVPDSRLFGAAEGISGRYEMKESASIAFLLSLEALSPSQRAVLLLRDVYDYSVEETADCLEMSTSNVKTTLHRARKALEAYDGERIPLNADRIRRTGEVLQRWLEKLGAGDVQGVRDLMTKDVRSLSDGNGRFYAAKVPVVGAEKVALLYSKITPPEGEPLELKIESLNGLPAVVLERPEAPEGFASRCVICIDLDGNDRITNIYTVLALAKLSAVRR